MEIVVKDIEIDSLDMEELKKIAMGNYVLEEIVGKFMRAPVKEIINTND